MQKFQLSEYLKISGIGAASGIVFTNHSLYIISDNAGYLYQYDLKSDKLTKHQIIKNPSQNIPKKEKPDFESITLKENKLYIFGSGSTQNRNKNIIFDIKKQQIQENDLSKTYQNIKNTISLSNEDLNIEGALFYNEKLYLLQRGNSANAKNGIIIIDNTVHFKPISLPKIKHTETSFTDATLVHNKIYFLAAAEDTLSTYNDGEILGTIIGCIDLKTFKIDFTTQISNTHKFEGITLFKNSKSHLEFLLCEDNDTEVLQTKIYKLTISKK
ncbi:DUF6929 family protein [Flavobacterium psychrophilum]|uniref:DUF6929 family protein n=1 Tax=Flavobacterium psychrophilum TaxID=96345 RepID=UPI001D074C2F|nr:hypothetical protein [Flavobacterium psychrophilum]MCB6099117.1 hypothetical protein [Flavobacterium psychrophilum]